MRVAVVGAGGLGGYFGGLLIRGGAEVGLIARGAHLRAIQERGLTLKSQLFGEFTVRAEATDDPGMVGAVDLVLFCVKTYDLEAAARQCRGLVGPETAVIPVQNGIDVVARLEEVIGKGRILGGLTYVAGQVEAPGVVVQRGAASALVFGELEDGVSPRAEGIRDFFQTRGMPADLRPDIRLKLWEKFTVICATGGVLAAARLPFGRVFACAETGALMRGVMAEVAALALASGVEMEAGTVDRLFGFLRENMAPEAKSSQLADLEAGRRLELESLNGAAVRLGREVGVETPLNFALYAALKPHAEGTPGPGGTVAPDSFVSWWG